MNDEARLDRLEKDLRGLEGRVAAVVEQAKGIKDFFHAELRASIDPLKEICVSLKELVASNQGDVKHDLSDLHSRLTHLELRQAEHQLKIEAAQKQVADVHQVASANKITIAKWGFAGVVLLALINAGLIKLFIGG